MLNHSVLKKQLRKLSLNELSPPSDLEQWESFLKNIDLTYSESDQDRYLLERSFDISSKEMQALNIKLSDQIKETKKRISEKRTQEKYLIEIINSLPGLFYVFGGKGHLLLWNKEIETITGYTSLEIKNVHVLDFFPRLEKKQIKYYLKKIIFQGHSEFESVVLCKNNHLIPYYFTGKISKYKGKKCIMGLAYNIEKRKVIENKLLERLEELDRWQTVILEREIRIVELKNEVNQLLLKAGFERRYQAFDLNEKSNLNLGIKLDDAVPPM